MELNRIIKNLGKYKILYIVCLVLGLLGGLGFYLLPKTYISTGSFYVKRSADTLKFKYFEYEGYYAQQTGISYTNTILALFESMDIRFEALDKLNLPTDMNSLRKYSRLIRAKKAGPQIITLTVTGKDLEETRTLWETVANVTLEKNKQMNVYGDPLLSVSKISENPVVKEQYKPLWMCALGGALLLPALATFYFTLREYFK